MLTVFMSFHSFFSKIFSDRMGEEFLSDCLGNLMLIDNIKLLTLSHVLCPNKTNDTSLESSCALLLESAKKLQICKNWMFLSQNPVI